jgi:hypothetical protein
MYGVCKMYSDCPNRCILCTLPGTCYNRLPPYSAPAEQVAPGQANVTAYTPRSASTT